MTGTDQGPGSDRLEPVGAGLQHERTALAWERTAIAGMVAGLVFVRVLASRGHPTLGLAGLVWVLAGAALLWWAASHDAMLHDPSRPASAVPQHGLTLIVGAATLALAVSATIATAVLVLR